MTRSWAGPLDPGAGPRLTLALEEWGGGADESRSEAK